MEANITQSVHQHEKFIAQVIQGVATADAFLEAHMEEATRLALYGKASDVPPDSPRMLRQPRVAFEQRRADYLANKRRNRVQL